VRNIFLFIRRYFNFLFFVITQVLAIMFIVRYNKFHESVFRETTSEITGRINKRYASVDQYFSLKATNEALAKENAELRRQLISNYESPDSSSTLKTDSLKKDSSLLTRRFEYLDAKVVGNSVYSQTNFIMIHRGRNQGVNEGMAVIGPQGVVGKVISVSANFADVMSMLHKYQKISAMLKKDSTGKRGGEIGSVRWDGEDPQYVIMERVPKSATVAKGDTVYTSNLEDFDGTFPPGIPIGVIYEIKEDKERTSYTLKLKTTTNFYNLSYVTVIKDLQKEERKALADTSRKKAQ
jgi:rod shape-determining protein MreC